MMFFNQYSGLELDFGKKLLTAQLRAGRIGWSDTRFSSTLTRGNEGAANFQSAALTYSPGKFSFTAAYYHLNSDWFKNANYSRHADTDDANIWEIASSYRFDKNTAITAAYAENTEADFYSHSHIVEFDYKGAKAAEQGSWGAYGAYRYFGGNTSIDPSVNGAMINTKGWEVGAKYIPIKNIQFHAIYFNGKQLVNNRDASKLFGRVQLFF